MVSSSKNAKNEPAALVGGYVKIQPEFDPPSKDDPAYQLAPPVAVDRAIDKLYEVTVPLALDKVKVPVPELVSSVT